jgi:flagellar FliJ protein
MKKFDFRLQRVIDVRDIKKQERARELAASQRELDLREQQRQAAAAERETSREGLRQALKKRSSAGLLATLEKWRHGREEAAQRQDRETAQQRQVVEECRESLVEAAKDKEILDRLKDRALAEYQSECLHEEQSFLDGLGCKIGHRWKYPRPEKSAE